MPTAVEITARNPVRCQLVSEVLGLSGRARVRVFGSSMLPSVLPGDILIVHRKEIARLAPGDIVLFKQEDRLFAHRVVSQHNREEIPCLVTCGDSLAENDPPVFPHELLGRVTSIIRGTRQMDPRATLFGRLTSILLRNSHLLTRCYLWLLCRARSLREETECPT
jgi:Peptidase S24-like